MSAAKIVNGYLINKTNDGQWSINSAAGEKIAGPFPTEAMAVEVAAVLELEHPEPKKRGKDKN
ncbi:hypothetical protein HNO86_17060 [Pseudomonas sp. C1C7]|uniref:hypothetical protein n=1 Tax=Pseudomonas sp. C1C7 TaxID=2735272 RepID=UPI001586AA52|nr:hypothetical protein [Pseudomonas sp. C1C7]NUT76757.1 hypothetical protein [Pseudomonas sp. C1C7]